MLLDHADARHAAVDDVLFSRIAQTLAEYGIRHEEAESGGEGAWVGRRDEQAGLFVVDEIGDAADFRADAGGAGVEGFLKREAEALGERGHGEDGGLGEELAGQRVGDIGEYIDALSEVVALDHVEHMFRRAIFGMTSGDDEPPVREVGGDLGESLGEVGLALATADRAQAEDDFTFGKIRQGAFVEDGVIDLAEAGFQRKEPTTHGMVVVLGDGGLPFDAGDLAELGGPAQAHGQQAVGKGALGADEEPESEGTVIGAHAAEAGLGNFRDGTVSPGARVPGISAAVVEVQQVNAVFPRPTDEPIDLRRGFVGRIPAEMATQHGSVRAGLKCLPRIIGYQMEFEAILQPLDECANQDLDSAVLVEWAFEAEGEAHEV